jgi:hypothetical protein
LPPLTVKSNVKEVRAATHASRNQMLAAIQSCDYVATAIRLLYRVSKVIHSECYGFDDDNSQIGPPNGKQIEEGMQDLHQVEHYRRQNTMTKSTHSEHKPMIRIVVLDPRAKLITVPRSKQLWYAQLRILCVQKRQ